MTGQHEAAVQVAVDDLVQALILAIRAELDTVRDSPDRLLSIDEAAKALGIGRTALYAELLSGELWSVKVGQLQLGAGWPPVVASGTTSAPRCRLGAGWVRRPPAKLRRRDRRMENRDSGDVVGWDA